MERAAKLAPERGGGSLTALPIAETQAGNISAYIPTNLISITDGQIYLDPRLFYDDQKPAVDVGKSVSRVGGKTQAPVLKALAESLRLEYAQFLELEVFTRFGTMVDERTRKVIEHGRRIRAVLGQRQFAPQSLGEQVALLCALSDGVLDAVPLERVDAFRAALAPVACRTLLGSAGARRREQVGVGRTARAAQGGAARARPIDRRPGNERGGGAAMTRLVELQGQIASMGELLDVVGAMRSLAGMRAQEAQRALPGVRRYAELDGGGRRRGADAAAGAGAAAGTRPSRAHSLHLRAWLCRRLQ